MKLGLHGNKKRARKDKKIVKDRERIERKRNIKEWYKMKGKKHGES